jgi:long-chain acyl-CoA synthetase
MPRTAALTERLVLPGSPYELVTVNFGKDALRVFLHAPRSLNGLYQKATLSSTRPCLSIAGRHFTYGEVLIGAFAVGRTLIQRYGVTAGQRVAIILPTCPQWFIAFIAVTSIGGVAVLVEAGAQLDILLASLSATDCVAVITDEATSQLLADHRDHRPCMIVQIHDVCWRRTRRIST